MSLVGVPPALRAQLDQQHAEYVAHLDSMLAAAELVDSVEPADRHAVILTAIATGLDGTDAQRALKAACLAAVAIERLSRQAKEAAG